MAIQQTKKQSDLEKRLRILRQQVYGKENKTDLKINNKSNFSLPTSSNSHPVSNSASIQSDLNYLNQDLLKIVTFSTVAIGAEFILLFLMKNNLLKLNFF